MALNSVRVEKPDRLSVSLQRPIAMQTPRLILRYDVQQLRTCEFIVQAGAVYRLVKIVNVVTEQLTLCYVQSARPLKPLIRYD